MFNMCPVSSLNLYTHGPNSLFLQFLVLSNYEKPKKSSNTILVSDDYPINQNLRVVRHYIVTFAKEIMTKIHTNSKNKVEYQNMFIFLSCHRDCGSGHLSCRRL